MKKIILPAIYISVFILLFSSLSVNAQGVNQIWGTTKAGGRDNMGVIFSTDYAGGNFQRRFEFTNTAPGALPTGNLVEYNGKFYGMTSRGGDNDNQGVIFEWDPASNIYTKKFDFSVADGRFPEGSLTLNEGKFYGLTYQGGANDVGVIFEWDPATNVYTKKIDFNFTDGDFPQGSLTFSAGKFYGATTQGGTNDKGVIFEWDPVSNIYTKEVNLNVTNGNGIGGDLKVSGSKLYGMTYQGGKYNNGVIFEYDPSSNIYSDKKDFTGTDGGSSLGSLILNGDKFYGMTGAGGSNNSGVIFEWDPATNLYVKKIDLNISTGRFPTGSLTFSAGKFYGMTSLGGSSDLGVIFEWNRSSNIYTKKIDLSTTTGSEPFGNLTVLGNKMYSITWKGGSNDQGVIFEWDTTTNVYSKKIQFNYSDGSNPQAALFYSKGKFFGTTQFGGNNNVGTIYEWDPATNTHTKKTDMRVVNLVPYNEKFYGVSSGGSDGVIFEWDTVSNVYTEKFKFNGFNGHNPASLILYNGKFYGTTKSGGRDYGGVLFEWDPVTNIYTKKIDLENPDYELAINGKYFGGLVLNNGKFYGKTDAGGINDAGVIFEYDPINNLYTKKVDLPEHHESSGGGGGAFSLFEGKFYGIIELGGNYGLGYIFEWDPTTNAFTKKFDFSGANGSSPWGTLILSAGKFYGIASSGGDYDEGVLFEWDPVSNIYTKKKDFNGTDGAYPLFNELTLAPAPVANGSPGSCISFPAITIDSSNNNIWVPITDTLGNAVAEIKANGNNLGVVSSSMFINNTTVRENATHKLYLDRNITLTPEVQPTSLVDIRLYIKSSEYLALKNASNSSGQPSGIDSLNDIGIFKNNDGCSSSVQGSFVPVPDTAGTWEADYVFSASISSFSSFYFANRAAGTQTRPTVSLITPANNATYLSGGNVYLNAAASDADGTISKVEFYNGTKLLFTTTDTPYTFKWQHLYKGNYTLFAKATDNNGLVTTSDSVHISVVPNKPPTVSIINPANGETFLKGAAIHLQAAASDPDGRITRVDFYNGTTLLTTEYKAPYTFDWRIGRSGNYTITAKATDNWRAVTTSAAINVSVVPNMPPTVSIINPSNEQTFTAPATINFEAAAQDADGRIVQVSFYNGATLLTNSEHKLPYTYQWKNVPAGTYTITAVAKDNWSAETTSAPITITVTSPGKPLLGSRQSFATIKADINEVPGMKLLPNPARNILNINTTGLQKNKRSTISVISASGIAMKTVQTNSSIQTIQLNVSSLASGMYLIKIISGDKVMYRQFVKL